MYCTVCTGNKRHSMFSVYMNALHMCIEKWLDKFLHVVDAVTVAATLVVVALLYWYLLLTNNAALTLSLSFSPNSVWFSLILE